MRLDERPLTSVRPFFKPSPPGVAYRHAPPCSPLSEGIHMHLSILTLIGALGLAAAAVSANAAPATPSLDAQQGSNIVQVSGGCGPGGHRNSWGHCVSYR